MNVSISRNKEQLGALAAKKGAFLINEAIAEKGYATIIVATGASQFEMLEALLKEEIDWTKIEAFHLDEYIGVPVTHPASFRKYLKERFVEKIGNLKEFHYISGDVEDVDGELDRLASLISSKQVDVAFVGVGENGHLAFNDPPADFDTEKPFSIVNLDEACRKQQLGEGWFPTFDDVPQQAISMGVRQIMKSKHIINTIPDSRKAVAVQGSLTGPVTNMCPASILQTHPSCYWFLDVGSASLLPKDFA